MAQYESLKSLGAATEDGNGTGNGNGETEPKARAKRGRKKQQSDETAIAKSPGHQLTNQQQVEASELIGGLERQEQVLIATIGYQEGQNRARLRLAAQTAGTVDVLTSASLERIQALQEGLKNNLENHNPLDILAGLGLSRTSEETQELREKIEGLDGEDFSRFLL